MVQALVTLHCWWVVLKGCCCEVQLVCDHLQVPAEALQDPAPRCNSWTLLLWPRRSLYTTYEHVLHTRAAQDKPLPTMSPKGKGRNKAKQAVQATMTIYKYITYRPVRQAYQAITPTWIACFVWPAVRPLESEHATDELSVGVPHWRLPWDATQLGGRRDVGDGVLGANAGAIVAHAASG